MQLGKLEKVKIHVLFGRMKPDFTKWLAKVGNCSGNW